MTVLAVNYDGRVFGEIMQSMSLDLVLLLLGIVPRHLPTVIAPRFFDHAFFTEEISALHCSFFVGGFEDEAIAEVQSEDSGFFATEGGTNEVEDCAAATTVACASRITSMQL